MRIWTGSRAPHTLDRPLADYKKKAMRNPVVPALLLPGVSILALAQPVCLVDEEMGVIKVF